MRCLMGVNLPYLYGSYGHDLAPSARFPDWPCDFRLTPAYRPLLEARRLGFEAVRIWLCEGAEGIVLDRAGSVQGLHPRLIESIRLLEEGAAVAGVRIYWGVLDANSAFRDKDQITHSILTDAEQGARFAEKVVAPIARALDREVLVGLELVNEPEVVTESCRDIRGPESGPSISWERVGLVLHEARVAALAEKDDLLITAGTGHAFLPALWHSGAGLCAIDIHMYHPEGGLPSRADLARDLGDQSVNHESVHLIAGECGMAKGPSDDPMALRNYVHNADKCGYSAAFLWKLEGDLIDATSRRRDLTDLGALLEGTLSKRPEAGFTW